jgi:hypothetical protein
VGGLVSEVDGKRLELLKETVPNLSRIAVWAKPDVPRHRRVVQDLAVANRVIILWVCAILGEGKR